MKHFALITTFMLANAWNCKSPPAGWTDFCAPDALQFLADLGSSPVCTPYSLLAPGTNLSAVRKQFINVAFGREDGQLPSDSQADAIETPGDNWRGCQCSALGLCAASACAWSTNLTKLTFAISVPVNASYTLEANSTVFYTLNTSGVAAVVGPTSGPASMPEYPMPPTGKSDVLVLVHNGHMGCVNNATSCMSDLDGTSDFLNQMGYDTMQLNMPGLGCNTVKDYDCAQGHAWFQQFEDAGVPVMRFFLEPVVRAVNYAVNVLGYTKIAMTGLSGGGWTTVVAAAIDPRIELSIPVAGSVPCDFMHTAWDYEQFCNHSWFRVANYSTLYAMAALEANRASLQVLHEQDPCCYHGCGRHDRIRAYNSWVRTQAGGAFQTLVSQGANHEFNPRDKNTIAQLVDYYRLHGAPKLDYLAALPYNTLNEW